ncbi:MAG: hypothetical protein OXH57_05485 [Ekhidna sp.]|nr:hypothetical protein [Ekhidna sp.]
MKHLRSSPAGSKHHFFIGVFLVSLVVMLWNYSSGYDQSIDWEVVTTADVIEFPALTIEGGLLDHEISGERYLLKERYSGTKIKRSLTSDKIYLSVIWVGICIFLGVSTYFNRYLFFVVIAAFALMVSRFNLFEVGLFGVNAKIIMLLPFLTIAGPLVYFHEFNRKVPLFLRIGILILLSALLLLGVRDGLSFTNHLLAHSVFCLGICGLIFLLFISEEVIFGFLYVVSSSKGKGNHLHFILLSLIYLGNLVLYYLNKLGIYDNSFFFFDPYVLFAVSCVVACWSLKHKTVFKFYIPRHYLLTSFASLGIVTTTFLGLFMSKGIDAVYQSVHYFILYFHIGFGFFFFFYILSNFLAPLVKGFQIWKITYKERNLPYVSAKIGGLVCIAAFYFFSGQEPYNLLRSGYYCLLGDSEGSTGNKLLAEEYWIQAAFLGYNTHYPNYKLAWAQWDVNKDIASKSHFYKAAQRFPSPYAWVNYGNLELNTNPNKIQAVYEEALRKMNSSEMENNLGLIHLEEGSFHDALSYFGSIRSSDTWNDAPKVNKWNSYSRLDSIPDEVLKEYASGGYAVKANILSFKGSIPVEFLNEGIENAASLHRQAFLLNASYLFDHDSIPSLLRKEIDDALLSSSHNRLSKALALHLYKKGKVNAAFQVLDRLQANAPKYSKGEYLDMLGKFALDQNAYKIALEYFNQAISDGHEHSAINRLEAFAALGQTEAFQSELLKIVAQDPGYTNDANKWIERRNNYKISDREYPAIDIKAAGDTLLCLLATENSFNEDLVLSVVDELHERKAEGAYHILVEAIEINRYSPELLKAYILTALDWGLTDYTIPVLERLKKIIKNEDYRLFKMAYEQKIEEENQEIWQ